MIKICRPFAENVLRCTIKIGADAASQQKKDKKRRKKEGLPVDDEESPQDCVLRLSCALLNSGGGVLIMKIADFQSPSSKDKRPSKNPLDSFWKTIEPKLKAMVKPATYDEVFDRCEVFESDEIFLYISTPGHFCSMEYNLFIPGDAGLDEASYEQTVSLLLKESQRKRRKPSVDVSLKDLPAVPRMFRYKEVLSFHESKRIQLKHFRSETILDSNNRTQRQGISKQISAFANASGGVILLGVTDEGEVNGLNLERNSKEDIEERINSILNKMFCSFTLERKVHWDMEFLCVSECESSTIIVVIYVAGMGSSVFAACPKSFELRCDEDGKEGVHLLEFDEWKQRMLSGMDLQGTSKGLSVL